jgi:ATP-binding cassette subfamily C protein
MVALTGAGALAGLVPPLALGVLVNELAGGRRGAGAVLAVVLIVIAIACEALAFTVSDGFFSRAVATLYRDLRVMMFAGARRLPADDSEHVAGLTSRFVSDAEAMQELIVAPLDSAVLGLFELVSALIAVAVLDLPAAGVTIALVLLAAAVGRMTQAPTAQAAQERQEALEAMSRSLAAELSRHLEGAAAAGRFREAASMVLRREVRLGWLQAASRYGSGAATNLGPIAVVVFAAFTGSLKAGTLLSLFLLAERAFSAAENLLEVGLDVEMVRGAVLRCFELVDGKLATAIADAGTAASAVDAEDNVALGGAAG